VNCVECSGSGACDACDGYGCYPDSYPNAGDGPDCDVCDGSGICPDCAGTGDHNQHDHSRHDGSYEEMSA
jgi:hypothetical protein